MNKFNTFQAFKLRIPLVYLLYHIKSLEISIKSRAAAAVISGIHRNTGCTP